MNQSTSLYPTLSVDATRSGIASHAGALALLRTADATGLGAALSENLSRWRKPLVQFDPGKIILDLAVSLALGGDCLATLREHTAVFGKVPSDPTVSRLITSLAADSAAVLTAIDTARAAARAAAWEHAGEHAPDHDATAKNPIVIDLDATLVTAHSEKESAAPTYKRGYGISSPDGVRRSRRRRHRRTRPSAATARQCRIQHCRRSHRRHQESIGAVTLHHQHPPG